MENEAKEFFLRKKNTEYEITNKIIKRSKRLVKCDFLKLKKKISQEKLGNSKICITTNTNIILPIPFTQVFIFCSCVRVRNR